MRVQVCSREIKKKKRDKMKKKTDGRTDELCAVQRNILVRARARRVRVRVVHSGPARRRVGNDGWMVAAAAAALVRPSPANTAAVRRSCAYAFLRSFTKQQQQQQ